MGMRAPASGFVPLFRSDQQHALLCFLFVLMPDGHMTMTQLADATGISASTVSREVGRLETAGIVIVETIGRAKLVTPNWASPISQPLRMMLTQTCGPLHELAALYDVPGVSSAFVFGSWAERYVGMPGPYPNDLDVLVVSTDDVDVLSIQTICSRISRDLKKYTGGPPLDINPVVVPFDDWITDPSPTAFLDRVKSGALVDVPPRLALVRAQAVPVVAGRR
jgi:Winged helix-turn-helix DNA-binding